MGGLFCFVCIFRSSIIQSLSIRRFPPAAPPICSPAHKHSTDHNHVPSKPKPHAQTHTQPAGHPRTRTAARGWEGSEGSPARAGLRLRTGQHEVGGIVDIERVDGWMFMCGSQGGRVTRQGFAISLYYITFDTATARRRCARPTPCTAGSTSSGGGPVAVARRTCGESYDEPLVCLDSNYGHPFKSHLTSLNQQTNNSISIMTSDYSMSPDLIPEIALPRYALPIAYVYVHRVHVHTYHRSTTHPSSHSPTTTPTPPNKHKQLPRARVDRLPLARQRVPAPSPPRSAAPVSPAGIGVSFLWVYAQSPSRVRIQASFHLHAHPTNPHLSGGWRAR